tara:strand:+ start:134 stop:349 length:216 start_codon:yes stop_codon:yes gene_type:complete
LLYGPYCDELDHEHLTRHIDNTGRIVPGANGSELLPIGLVLIMDLFWIIAGIFITAVVVSLVLGQMYGTFA